MRGGGGGGGGGTIKHMAAMAKMPKQIAQKQHSQNNEICAGVLTEIKFLAIAFRLTFDRA